MAANLSLVEAQPPLFDRIAAILTGATTSAAVSSLLRDVDAETTTAAEEARRFEVRALDPLTPAGEVEDAQAALIRATFAQKRLAAARERLEARLTAVQTAEREAEAARLFAIAKTEHDACVALLKKRYFPLVKELSEIIERCEPTLTTGRMAIPRSGAAKTRHSGLAMAMTEALSRARSACPT